MSGGSQVRIPLQPPRRDLGQVLHSQLQMYLWLFGVLTPTQYQCFSRDSVAPLSSRGFEEALGKCLELMNE